MAPLHDDSAADAPLIPASEGDNSHVPPPTLQSSGNAFLWALTLSACVSGLLFGFDTGVISGTLVSIGTDLSSRELTTLDKGLITSCTSLFALIASPIAGVLADKLGRKNIILCADALFTLGALWQAFTSSVWGMIFGRSIVGLAIGGASLIVPLYISELAPGHLRGRLGDCVSSIHHRGSSCCIRDWMGLLSTRVWLAVDGRPRRCSCHRPTRHADVHARNASISR